MVSLFLIMWRPGGPRDEKPGLPAGPTTVDLTAGQGLEVREPWTLF